jgi:hypothetical protein
MATAKFEQDFVTIYRNEGKSGSCFLFTDLSDTKNCMFAYCFTTDLWVGESIGNMHTEYVVIKDNCMDQQRAGGTYKDTIGFLSVTNDPKYPYPGVVPRLAGEGLNASAGADARFRTTTATLAEWNAMWPSAPLKTGRQRAGQRR